MAANKEGRCPYCNSDCFISVNTVTVTDYNPDKKEGEWWNKCRNCSGWSTSIVLPDGSFEQREMDQTSPEA